MLGLLLRELLNALVQIKKQAALLGGFDEALRPEKRGIAGALSDGVDAVQAGAGVDDGIARSQLDALLAEGVLHNQLATCVLLGVAEKDGGGNIGSDLDGGARNAEEGVVDMVSVGATAFIPVKARRQDLERQGRRHE